MCSTIECWVLVSPFAQFAKCALSIFKSICFGTERERPQKKAQLTSKRRYKLVLNLLISSVFVKKTVLKCMKTFSFITRIVLIEILLPHEMRRKNKRN